MADLLEMLKAADFIQQKEREAQFGPADSFVSGFSTTFDQQVNPTFENVANQIKLQQVKREQEQAAIDDKVTRFLLKQQFGIDLDLIPGMQKVNQDQARIDSYGALTAPDAKPSDADKSQASKIGETVDSAKGKTGNFRIIPVRKNNKWTFETEKNDMEEVQRSASVRGIDPTGLTREQLLAEIANTDQGIYVVDPVTGEPRRTGSIPRSGKTYKGVTTPEQQKKIAQAKAEGKALENDIVSTSKLSGAVKRLAILNKQFEQALPSGDRTPFEQRIVGGASSWAAKKGLINNPQLVALQQNLRPIAINMIRAFGEVGNLSETEQQGALDVVNQAGLTDQERIAATRQFIEYALAGARPESIAMIQKRPDIQGILDAFGVNLDVGEEVPAFGDASGKSQKIGRFTVEVE